MEKNLHPAKMKRKVCNRKTKIWGAAIGFSRVRLPLPVEGNCTEKLGGREPTAGWAGDWSARVANAGEFQQEKHTHEEGELPLTSQCGTKVTSIH